MKREESYDANNLRL